VRDANRPAAWVGYFHGIARLSVASIGDIAGENPRMAARNAVGGFAVHTNGGQPAILA
jgi:hypothetical protein